MKSAKESNDAAQSFLAELRPICDKKAKEFAARKLLRANEESSVAEAINILSSEVAQAKGASSFLQLHAKRRLGLSNIRLDVQRILKEVTQSKDTRLARLADLLQANNPFPVVFKEIKKMEELIDKEQEADEEKHAFCKKETDGGKSKLQQTNDDIDKMEEALDTLKDSVEKPETGLKAQEVLLETAMTENVANQKLETTMRQQDNVQYQKNIAELTKAEALLKKATKVLKKFYKSLDDKSGIEAAALLQHIEGPKPPSTWDGAYEGQSDDAESDGGAIGMIKIILEQTQRQNTEAHKEESEAQADYEDSMEKLTSEQKEQQKNMVSLKNALAKAEQESIDKKQDLKQAGKEKKATESYLSDIKPGCDFMFDNFDLRTDNRKLETKALVQARTLLKNSPVYQAAEAEAEADALGACKSKCNVPDHVNCKACLAKVSVAGYCAGHAGTTGCN